MKKFGGILIMSSNPNGNTIKNILSIFFDPECLKHEQLPSVTKITFLESSDMDAMKIDSTEFDLEHGYKTIIDSLSINDIEIRRKKIFNAVKDIPLIIMAAVREVGTDNIILDLTSGKKDITGLLYTAATMSGIENMTYIDVKGRPEKIGRGFYDLSIYSGSDKYNKYSLKKFESIDELEDLASMNNMEFIAYHKMIEQIRKDLGEKPKAEYYITTLESAIDNYFSQEVMATRSCIQKIGLINEDIVGRVVFAISSKYPNTQVVYHSGSPYKYLSDYQKEYNNLKKSKDLTPEKNADLANAEQIYSHIVPLYPLVETIRQYRNYASHNISVSFAKEDAKLAIDIIMRLLHGISVSPISDIVFGKAEYEEL